MSAGAFEIENGEDSVRPNSRNIATNFTSTSNLASDSSEIVAPEYLISNAAELFGSGKFNDALSASLGIFNQYPKDLSNLLLLSSIYFKLDQLEQCIEICDQMIYLEPFCVEAIYNISLSHYYLDNFDDSIHFLELIINLDPSFIDAYLCLISIHCELEKFDQALKIAIKSLHENPSHSSTLFPIISTLYIVSSKYSDATAILNQLKDGDKASFAYLNLGFIEAVNQNFNKACHFLEKSLNKFRLTSNNLTNLEHLICVNFTNCLIELNNYDLALDLLINHVSIYPNCSSSFAKIAYIKYMRHNYVSALEFNMIALRFNNKNSDFLNNTAVILRMMKNFTGAKNLIDRVTLLSGYSHWPNLCNSALLKFDQGLIGEALECFELLYDNFPFSADNIIDLASLYYLTKNYEKFIQCFNLLLSSLQNYQAAFMKLNKQLFKGLKDFDSNLNLDHLNFFCISNTFRILPLVLGSISKSDLTHTIPKNISIANSLSNKLSATDNFNIEMLKRSFGLFNKSYNDNLHNFSSASCEYFDSLKNYFSENASKVLSIPIVQVFNYAGWFKSMCADFECQLYLFLNLGCNKAKFASNNTQNGKKITFAVIFDSIHSIAQVETLKVVSRLNKACVGVEMIPVFVTAPNESKNSYSGIRKSLLKVLNTFDNIQIFDYEEICEILCSGCYNEFLIITELQDRFFFDNIKMILEKYPCQFWLPFIDFPLPVTHVAHKAHDSGTYMEPQLIYSEIPQIFASCLNKCIPPAKYKIYDPSGFNNFAITTTNIEIWKKKFKNHGNYTFSPVSFQDVIKYNYTKLSQFSHRNDFNLPTNTILFGSQSYPFEMNEHILNTWSKIIKSCNFDPFGVLLIDPCCETTKQNILSNFSNFGIEEKFVYFIPDFDSLLNFTDVYLLNPFSRNELAKFYDIYFSGLVPVLITGFKTLVEMKLCKLLKFCNEKIFNNVNEVANYIKGDNFFDDHKKAKYSNFNNLKLNFRTEVFWNCLFTST